MNKDMMLKRLGSIYNWYLKYVLWIRFAFVVIEFLLIGTMAIYAFFAPNPSIHTLAMLGAVMLLMLFNISMHNRFTNAQALLTFVNAQKLVEYQDRILKETRAADEQTITIITKQSELLTKMTSEATKRNAPPEPPKVIN